MNYFSNNTKHLTGEQLDAMLFGAASPQAAEHVQSCTACDEELASLRGAMSEFRGAATAVAARERIRAVPRAASRPIPRMAWAMAAMVLFVGISAPLLQRSHPVTEAEVKPVPVAAVTMSDDALLSSIQTDISYSVPEPLLPLSSASANAAEAPTAGEKP